MDLEDIREYCLTLPCTSEDKESGEDCVLFRVYDRIFACYGNGRDDCFLLKCDPAYSRELRDSYAEVTPAWRWNRRNWNQVSLQGLLHDEQIRSLIRHSYYEVSKKLPKRVIAAHPEISTIC